MCSINVLYFTLLESGTLTQSRDASNGCIAADFSGLSMSFWLLRNFTGNIWKKIHEYITCQAIITTIKYYDGATSSSVVLELNDCSTKLALT